METRQLMTITVHAQMPAVLGDFPLGERRLSTFDGGSFTGTEAGVAFEGTVAPGGTDWQIARTDGAIELFAHYLLRTSTGEPIEVESAGIRVMSADVVARLAAGERVDPTEYYFRGAVKLRTSSPAFDRWNRIVCISRGERTPAAVLIHIEEVL